MTKIELEKWVLEIADRVLKNEPIEDDRVELKTKWPDDFHKAARQIAGLANQARGQMILWIIGLNEKEKKIVGAEQEEFSDWYNQVKSNFDELFAPSVESLNVQYEDKILVALLFESDRVPFVVKAKDGGQIHREVPWREMNSTRSAHRRDLIKLLTPSQVLPSIEILNTTLELRYRGMPETSSGKDKLTLKMRLYVIPSEGTRVVIPHHQCQLTIQGFQPKEILLKLHIMRFKPPDNSPFAKSSNDQVIFESPEMVTLIGKGDFEIEEQNVKDIIVNVNIYSQYAERTIPLTATLSNYWRHSQGGIFKWSNRPIPS
jgi:Schlafen, AlbA_2